MKYKEWLNEWLENYVRPTAKAKTYERYTEIVNGHFTELGEMDPNEITPLDLQRFVTKLLKCGNLKTAEGLSANSVNAIVTLIQNSLKAANAAGLTAEYVADKIKRPKIAEKKVSCFTVSEQKRIEQEVLRAKNTRMFGVIISLYTGLRIGELLALEWSDIDFKRGTVSVSKTCHYGKIAGGKFERITDAPKTSASVRLIPLPRQLVPMLRRLHKQSASVYVVANDSRPIAVRCYQKSFESLLQKANIEHKGFHALRHTFATRALECGMDVKTLSEILGHKNPNVTLTRYVHSLTEHKRDMMNLVGKMINLTF